MGSRVRRIVFTAAAAATITITGTVPASTVDLDIDCKTAPPVESPSTAPGAVFDPGPDNPRPGDPFADRPTTTIYETYGYAGLLFDSYDTGCAPSPEVTVDTWLANRFQSLSQWVTGLSSALTQSAFQAGGWLGPFDAMVERVVDVFTEPALIWLPVSFIIVGLIILWRTRNAQYAEVTSRVWQAFAVLAVGVLLMGAPLWVARSLDGVIANGVDTVRSEMVTGAGGVQAPDPGVGFVASKHRSILYETWVQGTFGNASSQCAQRFAPDLFAASARTVDEERRAQDDADYRKQLTDQKNDAYESTAAEIEDFDEGCYQYVTGNQTNRVEAATVGLLSASTVSFFDGLAAVMVHAGHLMVRILAMFGLGLVLLAVFRPSILLGPVLAVGRVVLNALVFGIAVGGLALVQQALLGSALPSWVAAFLVVLSAVLFWRFTKAVRRTDPTGEANRLWGRAKRFAWETGKQYAVTRAAVDHGVTDAAELEEQREQEQQDNPQQPPRPAPQGPAPSTFTPPQRPAIEAGPVAASEPANTPTSGTVDLPEQHQPVEVEPYVDPDGNNVYPIYSVEDSEQA